MSLNTTHFEVWESVRLGMERIVNDMPLEQLHEVGGKLLQ